MKDLEKRIEMLENCVKDLAVALLGASRGGLSEDFVKEILASLTVPKGGS